MRFFWILDFPLLVDSYFLLATRYSLPPRPNFNLATPTYSYQLTTNN